MDQYFCYDSSGDTVGTVVACSPEDAARQFVSHHAEDMTRDEERLWEVIVEDCDSHVFKGTYEISETNGVIASVEKIK